MKKIAFTIALASGFVIAQDEQKPIDPCGSPQEFYSKEMLDKCYKNYFDAIVESKKLAEDTSKKINDIEGRLKKLENSADDQERRIRALEDIQANVLRKIEELGQYKWQLEEAGVVYFDFDKFNIKPSEAKKLEVMLERLREDNREILVVGFADKRGSSRYNFNLSTWRAQTVASYLARKGIDIGRIRIASYGKEVAELLGSKHAQQRAVRVYLIK